MISQVFLARAKPVLCQHDVLQYHLCTLAKTNILEDALVCISSCAGMLSRSFVCFVPFFRSPMLTQVCL